MLLYFTAALGRPGAVGHRCTSVEQVCDGEGGVRGRQTVVELALESLQRLGQHGDSDRNVVVENRIYQANEIPDSDTAQGSW